MILSGNTIEKYIKKGNLIKNANINKIGASSYDLSISNKILVFNKEQKISLIDASSMENMYKEVIIDDGYEIKPQETILVPLDDEFKMPKNISGTILGRTSLNRLGLLITTQYIHPCYEGQINLAITNNSLNTYIIMPKIEVAQIIFEKLDKKIGKQYITKMKTSKYQNDNGLTGSKLYKDYIGKVVRHFKGNYYYIENICLDSETKDYVVVYRTLYDREDSSTWTRSAKMFFEEIDEKRKDNITKQKHRFEVVDNLRIDYTKK